MEPDYCGARPPLLDHLLLHELRGVLTNTGRILDKDLNCKRITWRTFIPHIKLLMNACIKEIISRWLEGQLGFNLFYDSSFLPLRGTWLML